MYGKLDNAMTAGMLIEELQNYDPDAPVLFVCDYGDYHKTQQALPVGQAYNAETDNLVESAYSQSGLALVEDRADDEEGKEEPREVVILGL